MLTEHEIQIRVRYQETDAQGRAHHMNYFTYFEQGRVELLRAAGHDYRQLEAEGYLLVVAEISCQYFLPASYDDLLTLRTTTVSGQRGPGRASADEVLARRRAVGPGPQRRGLCVTRGGQGFAAAQVLDCPSR